MFKFEGTKLKMHKGDTGGFNINLSGREFEADDRLLFTVAQGKNIKLQRVYPIVDNTVTVTFENHDTDEWTAGTNYKWEPRFVKLAELDPETGLPVDGAIVRTPDDSPYDMQVLDVIGNI